MLEGKSVRIVMDRDAHMSKYTNTHFIHKPRFVYKTNFKKSIRVPHYIVRSGSGRCYANITASH